MGFRISRKRPNIYLKKKTPASGALLYVGNLAEILSCTDIIGKK